MTAAELTRRRIEPSAEGAHVLQARCTIPTRVGAVHRSRSAGRQLDTPLIDSPEEGVSDAQRDRAYPSGPGETAPGTLRSARAGPAGRRLAQGTQGGRMRTPRVREVVERIKKPTTTANRRSNLAIPRRPTTAARATPIVTPVKRWQGSTSQICNFGLQRSGAEHCAVIASLIENLKAERRRSAGRGMVTRRFGGGRPRAEETLRG